MDVAQYFEVTDGRGFFRPVGDAPLDEVVDWVSAAIAHARESGLAELLVDTRGVTGVDTPDVFQRYDLIKQWLAAAAGKVRIAMVVRPELIDHRKFGVTVAVNRGLATDAFTNEDEALLWLDQQRDS